MANVSRPKSDKDSLSKLFSNPDFKNPQKDTRSGEQKRVDSYNQKQNDVARTATGGSDWKPKQVNSDKDIAEARKKDGRTLAGATAAAVGIPAAVAGLSALGGASAAEAAGSQVAKKGAEQAVKKGAEGTIGKKILDKAGNIAKGSAKAAAKGAGQFVNGFERGLGQQFGVSRPAYSETSNKQGTNSQSTNDTSYDDTAQTAASNTSSAQSSAEETAKNNSANKSASAKDYASSNDRARQAEQQARQNVEKQKEMAAFKRDNENYQKRSSNIWNSGWN